MATKQVRTHLDFVNDSGLYNLESVGFYGLTTADRTSFLGTAAEGTLVYDTDLNRVYALIGASSDYLLTDKSIDGDSIIFNGSTKLSVDITGQVALVSGVDLDNTDEVLIWDVSASTYKKTTVADIASATGSGEVNTGANVGSGGIGWYDGKIGTVLNFRNILAQEGVKATLDGINSNIEVELDILGLTTSTIATGDWVAFYDISASLHKKITFNNFNTTLNHDLLSNYVANEHIDHSTVSITAGTGLSGGGDITTTRTLNFDPNGLTTTGIATGDFIPFADTSNAGSPRKVTVANFISTLSLTKKYSETATITAATPYVVNHNLALANQDDCHVQVWHGNSLVDVDVDTTSINQLTISTNTDMVSARIVVIGI